MHSELLRRLLEGIERELPRAVGLRHRLHEHPERAHAERWTAQAVAAELPVPCTTVAGTGCIATVGPPGAGSHAPVAVRAELDGLPIAERTGAPFSARGDAMHACGHDVHMAALVALARAAHAIQQDLPAPLLAVLQPSEEAYPSGAEELAYGSPAGAGREAKRNTRPAMETITDPEPESVTEPARDPEPAQDPEPARETVHAAQRDTGRGPLAELAPAAIVAAHVHPELRWGTVALDEGTVNASCDAVEIVVEGEPTHGAYPHH